MVPVPQAARVFADSREVRDEMIELQLRTVGAQVVRVARRFAREPGLRRQAECESATERVSQTR